MEYLNRICYLCGTYYTDDPFTEHPGHTREQCLEKLQGRVAKLKIQLRKAEDNLKRAKT